MANAIVGTLIILALPRCGAAHRHRRGDLPGGVRLRQAGDPGALHHRRPHRHTLHNHRHLCLHVVVLPMRSFSTFAGAFALAIIMIPTVTRATEEIMKFVPGPSGKPTRPGDPCGGRS